MIEAQKRIEARLEQAEARLDRLEVAVAELAEAQKRTEEELRQLIAEHRVTRERVEGVSNAVGYTLEDRAIRTLPTLLHEEGIEVEGRLVRRYMRVGSRERQLNIFGYGWHNGQRVLIVGESKVRPSRKEIRRFLDLVEELQAQEGIPVVRLFVAYDFPPSIETYLREHDIRPIWSYELPL